MGVSRTEFVAALESAGWNVAKAARKLGLSRQTVYTTMRRYGIQRQPADPAELSERQRANAMRRWA